MKGIVSHAATALAAALVLTGWTTSSHADTASGSAQPASPSSPTYVPSEAQAQPVHPPVDVVTIEEKVPNTGLISSGALMFGLPYVGSVIVGAASDRRSDRQLYI